jgi:hypothetical protein
MLLGTLVQQQLMAALQRLTQQVLIPRESSFEVSSVLPS